MNDNNDPFVATMAQCLTRTQQMLLELGYAYVAGDCDAWPMTFVEMQKRDSVLLVGPMSPNNCQNIAVAWQNISRQCPAAGLLVAGVVPVDHPAVQWLFQNTKGAVAYMDAARAQFRLRRPSAILTEPPLPIHDKYVSQFVNPAALSAAAAGIDCRARMAHDLAESQVTQEFQDQAMRLSGKPVMTYVLMGLCIAIYLVMYAPNWLASNPPTELLVKWGALFGPLVKDGQWWRLISSAFVHIGFMHLLFNMMACYYFGQPLELFQGKWRLAVFFLFSALVGGVTVLFWSPTTVCAGASGGLFGLMGAMLGQIVRYRRDFPPHIRQALKKWILTVLGYNVIFLFVPGISGAAHIGGFIGGMAISMVLSRSPIKPKSPSGFAWLGALALSACLAFGAMLAVNNIKVAPKPHSQPARMPTTTTTNETTTSPAIDETTTTPAATEPAMPT